MKLALVSDQPTLSRPARRYLEATVSGCAAAAGAEVDWLVIPAVASDQPGGLAPAAKVLRAERDGLVERVASFAPDAVVTMGAAAMNGWAGEPRLLQVRKEHGRMRLGELGVPWTPTLDPWRVVKMPDLHRDFAAVVYKAITQREPLPRMSVETVVCRDIDALRSSVALLEGASVVACDVETTGLRGWADEITAYGLGAVSTDGEGFAVVVPMFLLAHPEVQDILWDATWSRTRRTVGHNIKFDQQFIARLLGEWTPREAVWGDTLLLAHLLDERPNQPKTRARGSGLKDLVAQRYDYQYGFDFVTPYDELAPEELDALYLYLGDDVAYTARLWHDLEHEAMLESPRLIEVHDRLLVPVSRVISRAEMTGAPVDAPWVQAEVARLEARAARRQRALEGSLVRLAPTMVVENILAPQQIADVMYDEWGMTPDARKHGKLVENDRSTDQEHVKAAVAKYRTAKFRETHLWRASGWLQSLVRLRKDVRLASVYRKQLLALRDSEDRVHASFLLNGAETGRISATKPAVQTIPAVDETREGPGGREYKLRDGSWVHRPMRRAFAPPAGRLWVEADYSQLELRVAAGITGDEAFIDVFRSGRDVHREVASAIFSKEPSAISKAERYLAKAVSFGIIYGRSAKALAGGEEMDFAVRELGMKRWDEATAQAFISSFLASYPALTDWIVRLHEEVPAQGFVETPEGRRRRFPMVTDQALGAIQRQAVNTPIQGQASDICLAAMVRVADAIADSGTDAQVLFPVHDSICIEVGANSVKELEELCRREMEIDFMGCPLKIDFEVGPSWADVGK